LSEDARSSPVREEDVAAFERDGVVCLRGVIPRAWLERMTDPVERELAAAHSADLTEMARRMDGGSGNGGTGRFVAGTDHWRRDADFREFASRSPLPRIAAALLRSEAAFLYEDSVLVKEPGTREATRFHQDMGYFHVSGEQVCTTWCPLDRVTAESGALRYVRGSHRQQRLFKPNLFVAAREIPGTQGESLPDVDADPDAFDLVSFELEPGDVAVHHARTWHGAFPNASPRRRRAISVRYCGDDARYRIRPGAPRKPHHDRVRDGDPLGDPDCPRVWPLQRSSDGA
jgi:ectoine hydroxylase-related dioxygenase (phytanoyl-CoA dioxygenase family)